jgi:hypothetical protein
MCGLRWTILSGYRPRITYVVGDRSLLSHMVGQAKVALETGTLYVVVLPVLNSICAFLY